MQPSELANMGNELGERVLPELAAQRLRRGGYGGMQLICRLG